MSSSPRVTTRRRTRAVGPVVVTLALVLSGCGSGVPADVTPSPAPTPNQTAGGTSRAGAVELTVLDHQVLHLQALALLLPRFEAEMAAAGHPVHVRLETGPTDDGEFRAYLEAAYAKGTGPDLTAFAPDLVPALVAKGELLDLSDRLAAWPDWQAHFYPVLRQRAVQRDGHTYSVPRGANVIELFYRRDVLTARGIATSQPRTWDELLQRMRLLAAATGRPPLLIPGGRAWGNGGFFEGFVDLALASGETLYDEATGRWVVRSPGLDWAFATYATLARERLLPIRPLLGAAPWQPTKYFTFPAGDLPVTTQGTWGWKFDWGPDGRAPIADLQERVATWEFPGQGGSAPFVWAAENWMWAISARSAHPDEAFRLLQWLNSGQALAIDLVAVGNLSPRDDIQGVPPYRDAPYLIEAERLLRDGRSVPLRPGVDALAAAAAEATQAILEGKADGPAAAALFADLARRALPAASVTTLPGP